MAQAAVKSDAREAELRKLVSLRQGAPRTFLPGVAAPFSEFSMTDMVHEMAILEAAGAAWGRKFVQASVGHRGRGGGSWVSCEGFTPRSVVHPEKFFGKSTAYPAINFWAEYLHRGLSLARDYTLPFSILAQFDDGLFALSIQPEDPLPTATVGTRIAKPAEFADCENLVITFQTSLFKQVSRSKK